MKDKTLLPVTDFCRYYNVEIAFFETLKAYKLVEITTVKRKDYVNADDLQYLEKLVRLHYDLEINPEGIDVITRLLEQIESMHREMNALKNKLMRYEQVYKI